MLGAAGVEMPSGTAELFTMARKVYSLRMELTGLSVAARQLWNVTVSMVTADTAAKARANTHQWSGVR